MILVLSVVFLLFGGKYNTVHTVVVAMLIIFRTLDTFAYAIGCFQDVTISNQNI